MNGVRKCGHSKNASGYSPKTIWDKETFNPRCGCKNCYKRDRKTDKYHMQKDIQEQLENGDLPDYILRALEVVLSITPP